METSGSAHAALTVLAAHPGAELFGSDRMFLESVEGLCRSGARVVATLPAEGPLVARLRGAGAEVVIEGAFVLRKALFAPRRWPRLSLDLVRGLRSGVGGIRGLHPDVIYASTVVEPLWPLLGALLRVPVVSHVHEAEASRAAWVARLLYLPHALSTRIIVNSRFTRDTLARVVPTVARRADVVLNGVEGPHDRTAPGAEPGSPLRVAYLGRLSPRKAPDLVLEAAHILAAQGIAVHVCVVGNEFSGYEWYGDSLRAQAAALSDVSVSFAGFQSDVWPWIAASDVLVVPSREDESFGNTVVEGVLAERPVVFADMSGLREAARGLDTAVAVTPDDAPAIAEALDGIRRRWSEITPALSTVAEEARRRHSPRSYRKGVVRIVTGAATAGRGPRGTGRWTGAGRTAAKAVVRGLSSATVATLGVDRTQRISSRSTLVIAPHPDDETLGCGATIARLRALGTPVHVLVVSDGGGSPLPAGLTRDELVDLRRGETRRALAALGVGPDGVSFWGLPDGALGDQREELARRLRAEFEGRAPAQVIVTSGGDRHPDHAAIARATSEAVSGMEGAPDILEYAVWQRFPALPVLARHLARFGARLVHSDAVGDAGAEQWRCDTEGFLDSKRDAIAAYTSQLPHFPPGFVEDFLRPFEHFTARHTSEATHPREPGGQRRGQVEGLRGRQQ